MTTKPKSDEELAELLEKAAAFFAKQLNANGKIFTAKQADRIASILQEFITEEEFDYETITDDLSEGWEDSEITDGVLATCDFLDEDSIADKKNLYKIINDFFNSSDSIFENINWNIKISKKDVNAVRDYLCLQVGQQTFRESGDVAFLKFVSIGKKHDINLPALMYDAYSKYRMIELLIAIKSNTNVDVTAHTFLEQSQYVQDIRAKNNKLQFQNMISSYEARLIPKMNITNYTTVINDNCDEFIEHALMMATVVKQVLKNECCPLQVDMVIIPAKIVENSDTLMAVLSFDEDDDEDDDEEEDDDVKSGDEATDAIVCSEIPLDLEKVFNNKNSLLLSMLSMDNGVAHVTRSIVDAIVNILKNVDGDGNNTSSHQRIEVVIDRRSKTNKAYVYALPGKYHRIRKDYCVETLVMAASKNILPNGITGDMKGYEYIGGNFDCKGHMFCMSIQATSVDDIRLQWYYNGGSIRMWPEYMINLWPIFFADDGGSGKFNEKYIEDNFILDVSDTKFDAWYEVLRLKPMAMKK